MVGKYPPSELETHQAHYINFIQVLKSFVRISVIVLKDKCVPIELELTIDFLKWSFEVDDFHSDGSLFKGCGNVRRIVCDNNQQYRNSESYI